MTFDRLGHRPLWQVGLALLALYLAAFAAIVGAIHLLALVGPLLGLAGASLAVAWAFLAVTRRRHDREEPEWFSS